MFLDCQIHQLTYEKLKSSNNKYARIINYHILAEYIKKNDINAIEKIIAILTSFDAFDFDGLFISIKNGLKKDFIRIVDQSNQDIFAKIQNNIALENQEVDQLKTIYNKLHLFYLKNNLYVSALKIWLVILASELLATKQAEEIEINFDDLLFYGSIQLATLLTKKFFSQIVIVNNSFIYGLNKNSNGSALTFLSSASASIGSTLKNYFRLNGIDASTESINQYLEIAPKINSLDIPKLSHNPKQYCLFFVDKDELTLPAEKEKFVLIDYIDRWEYFESVKALHAWWCFLTTLETTEDRELFLAWVYSIFMAQDKIRQIAYLYGDGRTGKSTIAKVIFNYCNKRYGDNFAQSYVIDSEDKNKSLLKIASRSQLLILSDLYKRNVFTINGIKNITGDDPMLVKIDNQFKTENIYCKILIHSNKLPAIALSSPVETSRILFFPIDSKISSKRIMDFRKSPYYDVNSSNSFYDKLIEEFPLLLQCAKFYYNKHKALSQRNDCFLFSSKLKQRMLSRCQDLVIGRIDLFYRYNTTYSESTDDKIFLIESFFNAVAKFVGRKPYEIEDDIMEYLTHKQNFKNISGGNLDVRENYSRCYLQNRKYAYKQISLAEAENREILATKHRVINEHERFRKF